MSTIKSSAENLTLNADGANNDIKFQSNGSEVASIDQAGTVTATTFTGAGSTPSIVDGGNATAMTIDSAENVGFGSAPTSFYSGYTGLQLGGNGALYGQTSAGANKNLWVSQNARAGTDGSEKAISTGTSSQVMMADGNVTIKTGASASADANVTWTTGIELLASGKARTKNGLLFGTDTAAANTLDDYEEGSWTPTLNNTGGSPSYTWQKGHYVKVGAWVWLTANVKFTVTPSGASQQAVGGLPFANRNGAGQYTAAMFTPKQGFAYDGDGLTADIYDGSTIAYLEEYIAGTGGNGGSLLANEIGTTVEFRFSTFYTTS